MGEYREEWDNYLCLVEKETASMFLDLGYARVAPLAEKPWLIRVRLACRAVRENGLPTSDEMTALQDLEEEVLSRVEGRASLSLVGSVTTGGAREIVFYASTDDALKEDELTMVVPKRRAAPFLVAEEDPAWEYYLQFMQPSAEEYRRMLDTRVLRNLDRDGDVSSTPRRVDHWVYFEDAGARDRFVAWAVGEGYSVEQRIDPDDERDAIGVQIHHVSDVLPGTIHPTIASLVKAAEDRDGRYDGWETFVMRAAGPPTDRP